MSQAQSININEANLGPDPGTSSLSSITLTALTCRLGSIDDQQYPSRSVQNHTPQGESGFVDSSGPIFSMYMEMAEEEDKKLTESWKADADGILIFVRIYLLALCLIPIHQL